MTGIRNELKHADSRRLVLKGAALCRAIIKKSGLEIRLAMIGAWHCVRGCRHISYDRVIVQPRIMRCMNH
jgi:hypothetical protein